MGIRESLLNTITSVADSDFVRVVTSAGASSKATVKNLFKSFESNLGAMSSLTTSDYIRVVGSDNNSYKQTLSAIMSTMGVADLNSMFRDITWTANADLNTYKTSGFRWISTGATNGPTGLTWFALFVMGRGTDAARQFAVANNGTCYVRTYQSSTWSAWQKMPTRAEMDALTTPTSESLTAGTNITFATGYHNAATKVGRVVTVEFALTASDAIASGAQLATVPSGYRPSKQVRAVCYHTTGYGRFAIEPSGKVQAYSTMASGQSVIGTITYIV